MKSKVILNEKQKELVEKFKDILNQMKNENIGIIDNNCYLYCQYKIYLQ